MKLSLGLALNEINAVLGGGLSFTNCWTPLIQLADGGYGHDDAQAEDNGTLIPNTTSDGVLIYSFRFYDNGNWFLQFGADGKQQIPNASEGVLRFSLKNNEHILLAWNDVTLAYEGFDIDTATELKTMVGEEVCVVAAFVPTLLIYYNFAELERV